MAEKVIQDEKLIELYLKGDARSLDVLIERYLKMIYRFVYRNIGSLPDAEDITQEVFLKMWKNLRKFDLNKSFKPWIFQIAKNASIDFLRKKKTLPLPEFEIADKSHNSLEKLSDKNTVALLMERLSYRERVVINMRHNDGLNFREIAKILKEPINTVKSRYRRGIMNLRESIKRIK